MNQSNNSLTGAFFSLGVRFENWVGRLILDSWEAWLASLGIVLTAVLAWRAKTSAARVATHPVRRALLDEIHQKPGARATWLQRTIAANRGTINYHLQILSRAGVIRVFEHVDGPRYFPLETPIHEPALLTELFRGRMMEIVEEVLREPGVSQKEVTGRLEMSRKVFRAHADVLFREGLIDEVRSSRSKRYYPTAKLAEVIKDLRGGQGLAGGPR